MAQWLKVCGIQTVVMQATGVYWIALYQILEDYGLNVNVVNAHHTKTLPGRNTDVLECQWLQKLHTFGLLNNSFQPAEDIWVLRTYMRQREKLVAGASTCIQHIQKALTEMNIQLANVISDISGMTGMAILRAIVNGERNPQALARLKGERIHATREEIAQSLEGTWRPELLFVLEQSLALYDTYQQTIAECNVRIEAHLKSMESKTTVEQPPPKGRNRGGHRKQTTWFGSEFTTVSHRRCGPHTDRWDTSANGADRDLGSGSGYEPLENREAVCLLAGIMPGQSRQRRQSP